MRAKQPTRAFKKGRLFFDPAPILVADTPSYALLSRAYAAKQAKTAGPTLNPFENVEIPSSAPF
jgi:hypothetical protein